MQIISRGDLEKVELPGRVVQKAVGLDAYSLSKGMTMGFAQYSEETDPMEPHHHAEEIVYVVSAENGWIRNGPERDQLGPPQELREGMTIHIPAMEWHVFEYGQGGHVDIIFFYGQVDNIRPEENN